MITLFKRKKSMLDAFLEKYNDTIPTYKDYLMFYLEWQIQRISDEFKDNLKKRPAEAKWEETSTELKKTIWSGKFSNFTGYEERLYKINEKQELMELCAEIRRTACYHRNYEGFKKYYLFKSYDINPDFIIPNPFKNLRKPRSQKEFEMFFNKDYRLNPWLPIKRCDLDLQGEKPYYENPHYEFNPDLFGDIRRYISNKLAIFKYRPLFQKYQAKQTEEGYKEKTQLDHQFHEALDRVKKEGGNTVLTPSSESVKKAVSILNGFPALEDNMPNNKPSIKQRAYVLRQQLLRPESRLAKTAAACPFRDDYYGDFKQAMRSQKIGEPLLDAHKQYAEQQKSIAERFQLLAYLEFRRKNVTCEKPVECEEEVEESAPKLRK